mmetsp:Transcript_89282/g.255667  ORF Transcript_89282/g.255667 Transcript_89282/m.255667 type:complete len:214 (-) Transcript_89282:134-775(-)
MAQKGIEEARLASMLQSLQANDPMIDHILVYSKFVVAYLLQQDQPNPGWRKANIEGPVYIYRRRVPPLFQLLVKNQFSTNDLLDDMHPQWELDCQNNYVFYKVEDPSKRIRGLWFHDDAERQRVEGIIQNILKEMQVQPSRSLADPTPVPPQSFPPQNDPKFELATHAAAALGGHSDALVVSRDSLRGALRALADDDTFVAMLMQKLREQQRG